jgi:hypothetical protein
MDVHPTKNGINRYWSIAKWPLSLGIPIFFWRNDLRGTTPERVSYPMTLQCSMRWRWFRSHEADWDAFTDSWIGKVLETWKYGIVPAGTVWICAISAIRIEMCVFVRNGVFKVSHNQGFPDVIPTAKEESSVFLVVSNASRNRSEDSQ